jgi:multidrug efflux pump subunit AcrA (membrane-fusion protein)
MRLPARARSAACAGLLLLAMLGSACRDGGSGSARAQPAPESGRPAGPAVVAMARAIVELPGGLTELQPLQDGVVASVDVQEGQAVQAGQVLLRLSAEAHRRDLAVLQAELQLARSREAAQAARLPAAQRSAERLADAARADVVDTQRADDARQALADTQSALAVARAETALVQRRVEQLQAQATRLVLTAAHDASVLRMQAQPGMRVAPGGKPLLVLVPTRALRLRAEVNEAYAAAIHTGMRATLRLDGEAADAAATPLPGAHVLRLSPVVGAARLEDDSQPRGALRVVDCLLAFDSPPPLRIGQTLRVEFHSAPPPDPSGAKP